MWFGALAALAYLLALVATWPARFAFDPGARWALAGTVWNGEAVLDGAYRVEWRFAPMRSLASLAYAADWRMSGGGTDLAGSATRGGGRLVLEGVSGRGDGALVAALAPGLPFQCDAPLMIDMPRVVLAGGASSADGEVRSEAGSCTAGGIPQATTLPALVAHVARDRAGVTTATIAPLGQARFALVQGSLAGGRLTIVTTDRGGALLPFLRGLRFERSW